MNAPTRAGRESGSSGANYWKLRENCRFTGAPEGLWTSHGALVLFTVADSFWTSRRLLVPPLGIRFRVLEWKARCPLVPTRSPADVASTRCEQDTPYAHCSENSISRSSQREAQLPRAHVPDVAVDQEDRMEQSCNAHNRHRIWRFGVRVFHADGFGDG